MKVDKLGPDECWLWKAATNGPGYGVIGRGGMGAGNEMAHRVSYMLAHGPIPPKAMVLHSCDVKQCVNPAHLRLGTARENAYDAIQRGQWNPGHVYGDQNGSRTHPESRPHGEANTAAKLTEAAVAEIRRLYATGNYYQREIGATYGINQVTVSCIVRGQTWTNNGEPLSGPRKPRPHG